VRGVGSGDAAGVKRRTVVERPAGVEQKVSAGQDGGAEVHAETKAPLVKRLPSLSGTRCRLRRAAQMPGVRRIGDAGGQQHRQVNRPKNQCYRESLSWGHVRQRKCNHL